MRHGLSKNNLLSRSEDTKLHTTHESNFRWLVFSETDSSLLKNIITTSFVFGSLNNLVERGIFCCI